MDGVTMPRKDSAMDQCEKGPRQEFTQKYPSLSSAEETHLEKEIQEAVMKHHKILQRNAAAHEQYHPPPPPPPQPKHDRTQEREISMGLLKNKSAWDPVDQHRLPAERDPLPACQFERVQV
jgi:hypothetical protein